jgi:ELWxxDGT repeat protein
MARVFCTLILLTMSCAAPAFGQRLVSALSLTHAEQPVSHDADVFSCGDRVFFSFTTHDLGREPWVTDGTPQGTFPLGDFAPGRGDSYLANAVKMGDAYYFLIHSGYPHIDGLYRSDGTPEGTSLLRGGLNVGTRAELIVEGDRLYFAAVHNTSDHAIWISDGTAQGTQPLHSLTGFVFSLTVFGHRLYYYTNENVFGIRLWALDLTAGGSAMLAEIHEGPLLVDDIYSLAAQGD